MLGMTGGQKPALNFPDLRDANLGEADLNGGGPPWSGPHGANLSKANLCRANLREANLSSANLRDANLGHGGPPRERTSKRGGPSGRPLGRTSAGRTSRGEPQPGEPQRGEPHESGPQQGGPRRGEPQLGRTSAGANLSGGDPQRGELVETNLADATLTGCAIYGISAWNVKLSEGTKQQDLIITPPQEPAVTVDDLEVAQFVYLLLHNEKIRRVIDTVGKKGVLLLGRFTEGRIEVLERLREELRKAGLRPHRIQLRQAGDEGLHRDGAAARWAVEVRHRRHHQPQVIAAGAASDDP